MDWMGSDVASVVARVGSGEGKVRQKDNTKKQLFSSSNNNKKN